MGKRGGVGIGDLWRVLVEVPLPTVLVGPSGRARVNGAAGALLGRDPAQLIDASDLVAPDEADALAEDLAAVSAEPGGPVRVVRRTCVRSDGTRFPGELTAFVVVDPDRHQDDLAVVVLLRDVSAEVAAAEALERSVTWHRALIEHSNEILVLVDEGARPFWYSPAAERLFGWTVEERRGAAHLSLIYEPDRAGVLIAFANVMNGEGPFPPFHARVVRRDGGVRFIEATATNMLDDPDVRGVLLHLRDITDEPDARSALEVTESRFRKMLENISDTVTLLDGAGRVLDTTGNVKAILGYSEDFWRERNAFDLVHPDDAALVHALLDEVLERPHEPVSSELRVRHADGHYEVVEATAVNLLEVPDVRAIVLTTRNITARKEIEAELAAARDTALRNLEERTAFVANVSHELRTPIHGVLALSELLLAEDLQPEVRELVRSIERATESLKVMLDDILDFAKVEAGRIELHVRPVRLADVISDLTSLFGPQVAAQGLALQVEVAEDLPSHVSTDGFRLRQVLTNLLGNAVRFTGTGTITLRVQRESDRDGAAEHLRFAVVDTGPGIAPGDRERIFEPFAQGSAPVVGDRRGTGLGLTIAGHLVELLGGELVVTSEVGVGSTFSFVLPVAAPDHDVPAEAAEVVTGVLAGARVLVVVDNAVERLLLCHQLEQLGCAPVASTGAAEVPEILDADPPDLIVVDRRLADRDGVAVAGTVRRWTRAAGAPRIPLILLTASQVPADRTPYLDAGIDDVLAKPVPATTLARSLSRALLGAAEQPTPAVAVAERSREDPCATDDPPLDVNASAMAAFDVDVLERLAQELDDPATVANILRSYLRELRPRLDLLEGSLRSGDAATMEHVAHTLASTSAAVGAVGLRDGAEAIERCCRQGEAHAVTEASLVQLRAAAASVNDRLEQEMIRLGPVGYDP